MLGDRVLVQPDKPATRSAGGLMLIEHNHPSCTGRVISVGTKMTFDGKELQRGDRVAFRPFAGQKMRFDGVDVQLLKGEMLIGKILDTVVVQSDQ